MTIRWGQGDNHEGLTEGTRKAIASAWVLFSLLVLDLFLDGIFRRLATEPWATVLYFIKDGLCLALWLVCARRIIGQPRRWLWVALACFIFSLLPTLLLTALHDPWLALYGLKQRVLPMGVALAVFTLCREAPHRLPWIIVGIDLLLVLSGLLAVWQTYLPVGHWLNCIPGGGILPPEHIKAGVPRVSSSFPFLAQYSYFLNLALPVALAGVALLRSGWARAGTCVVALAGAAGAVATASRSPVFGPALSLSLGFLALLIRREWKGVAWTAIFLVFIAAMPVLLRHFLPNAVAGYDYRAARAVERSGGNLPDIVLRLFKDNNPAMLNGEGGEAWLGGGLGYQSRGTEVFSRWAASQRQTHGWAEMPLAASFSETGWWGVVTGLVLRLGLVTWLWVRLWRMPSRCFAPRVQADAPDPTEGTRLSFGAPLLGFVTVVGCLGGMDFQFPLACWFWLAVGMLLVQSELIEQLTDERMADHCGRS